MGGCSRKGVIITLTEGESIISKGHKIVNRCIHDAGEVKGELQCKDPIQTLAWCPPSSAYLLWVVVRRLIQRLASL